MQMLLMKRLHYKALEMHQGAIVEGMLIHVDESQRPGLKLAASAG